MSMFIKNRKEKSILKNGKTYNMMLFSYAFGMQNYLLQYMCYVLSNTKSPGVSMITVIVHSNFQVYYFVHHLL